jgi:hypothetical protein
MVTPEPFTTPSTPKSLLWRAWLAVLAGPVAWSLQLQLVYWLAYEACVHHRDRQALHGVTVACLALTLGGGLAALATMRSGGGRTEAHSPVPFLGRLGLLTAALFAIAIVAGWIIVGSLPICPTDRP